MDEPQKSLAFMQDPWEWPNLALPVKRVGDDGHMEVGMMTGLGPRVYLCNMWVHQSFDTVEFIDYPDFEGVVDDGWRVD